jgi:hypothetical protein
MRTREARMIFWVAMFAAILLAAIYFFSDEASPRMKGIVAGLVAVSVVLQHAIGAPPWPVVAVLMQVAASFVVIFHLRLFG